MLTGIKHEVPEALTQALDKNVFVFSGLKTYHELKQASLLLKDENGGIKPYKQFELEMTKLHQAYNVNYLQAEYNFATASAQMAAKWNDFEQDGDDYNLQFRTAADEKVRSSHQALHDTTLPASDPFWNEYIPPLDWNCRCTVVQVLKDKYPLSNSTQAILEGEKATTRLGKDGVNRAAMFRFNPGKQKVIFPEKHPYFKVKQRVMNVINDLLNKTKPSLEVKKLRLWAKQNIAGKAVKHPELTQIIKITNTGIKEYLNQPHSQYKQKNELIKRLKETIESSNYLGKSDFHKSNTGILYSHIFEIEIDNKKSWLIARENTAGSINFYSISESEKVLKGLIKKRNP